MAIRAGVLTISDKASRGERADTSGDAIRELLASIDAAVERSEVVPDERERIGSARNRFVLRQTNAGMLVP